MSEEIREYENPKKWFKEYNNMLLTAIVGGKEYGHSIQFEINGYCCILTEKQLLDLISTIANRISCKSGFKATGYTELKTVLSDGIIIVKKEEW